MSTSSLIDRSQASRMSRKLISALQSVSASSAYNVQDNEYARGGPQGGATDGQMNNNNNNNPADDEDGERGEGSDMSQASPQPPPTSFATSSLLALAKFVRHNSLTGSSPPPPIPQPETVKCTVHFLDESQHLFELDRTAKGEELLELVFRHLELIEREYFALQFSETVTSHTKTPLIAPNSSFGATQNVVTHYNRWLDPSKKIRKQLRFTESPYTLHFRVKFYVSEITRLFEEYTRYHFYLQLRKDILDQRLSGDEAVMAKLASFVLQSELGDFNADDHLPGYSSSFALVPNQSDAFEQKVESLHRMNAGQTPADAELNYLEEVKNLEFYGVDLHTAQDCEGHDIEIGVCGTGLIVFRNLIKLNTFSWAKIVKISFKRRFFFIQLKHEGTERFDNVVGFNLCSYRACKSLWKACVEQHTFFRLHTPKPLTKKFFFFFSLGSKFRYSGKTEFQTIEENKRRLTRTERIFIRNTTRTVSHNPQHSNNVAAQHLANLRMSSTHGRTMGAASFKAQNGKSRSSSSASSTEDVESSASLPLHTNGKMPTATSSKNKYCIVDKSSAPSLCVHRVQQSHQQQQQPQSKIINGSKQAEQSDQNATNVANVSQSISCDNLKKSSILSSILSSSLSSAAKAKTINGWTSTKKEKKKMGKKSGNNGAQVLGAHGCDDNHVEGVNGEHDDCVDGDHHLHHNQRVGQRSSKLPSEQSGAIAQEVPPMEFIDQESLASFGLNNSEAEEEKGEIVEESLEDTSKRRGQQEEEKEEEEAKKEKNTRITIDDSPIRELIKELYDSAAIETAKAGPLEDSSSNSCSSNSSPVHLVTIRMKPDCEGRFGFNVKGGADQNCDILISRVAPNTPADSAYPSKLHEGDQVLTINGVDVAGMKHDQVVSLIRSTKDEGEDAELCLIIRPLGINIPPDDEPPEPAFQYTVPITTTAAMTAASNGQRPTMSSFTPFKPLESPLEISMNLLAEGLESETILSQFEQLPRRNEREPITLARAMDNIAKNRYLDIAPYDSTRVILEECISGDYINASYVNTTIPSTQTLNKYIATQGPLKRTTSDFWQMIWEQRCSVIVMVTPLVEDGRKKCYKYWPDPDDTMIVNEKLELSQQDCADEVAFLQRTFVLRDPESGDSHSVTHLQYLAWPDQGIPDDDCDFLKLINRVRELRCDAPDAHVVVHCSAGIGRTGVLILMETGLCLIEANEPLYPLDLVRMMRNQRAMLIQTTLQFYFVCHALYHVWRDRVVQPLNLNAATTTTTTTSRPSTPSSPLPPSPSPSG